MKKCIVLLIISISFSSVFSQNIIRNGSFELFNNGTSIPTYPIIPCIDSVLNWVSAWGTCDHFSVQFNYPCCQTPNSVNGYQIPRTGTNYGGFGYWSYFNNMTVVVGHNEHFEVHFSSPLVQNQTYRIRAYLSNAGWTGGARNYTAYDSLGFVLSDTMFMSRNSFPINNIANVIDTSGYYTDSIDWMEVGGLYTAHGGEEYMIIGFHMSPSNHHNLPVLHNYGFHLGAVGSYHYLDDVAIWPADTVPPVADAGLDTTICRGGKAKLGTHTYSDFIYQWSPTAGLSNDSGGVVWASPDTTTTYYLLATDDIFTKTKDSVTVFVNNCGQNDTTVCIENQFIIGTSPNPAWNYLWSPSTWLSSSTVATPICSPMVSQSYQLLITNTAGDTIALDSTHVLVASCFFADAGLNPLICKDDSIQIGTHHFPYVQYHWTPNYMLSNPSVGNPVAWPDTSTYYYLQVTDSIGNVSNDSVLVNVQICTGINELYKPNLGLEVYPNPANDVITFEFEKQTSKSCYISIFNVFGQELIHQPLKGTLKFDLDISELKPGMYIYSIISDGNKLKSDKLIKN